MEGYLTIDRMSPRLATRIVCYPDSDEGHDQRIVISADAQTLQVFRRRAAVAAGDLAQQDAFMR